MLASVGGNAWVPLEWEPDTIFEREGGGKREWRGTFHVPFLFHFNLQESLASFCLILIFRTVEMPNINHSAERPEFCLNSGIFCWDQPLSK